MRGLLLLALGLSSCGERRAPQRDLASAEPVGSASAPQGRPPRPFVGKKTAELVRRAEVAALVDDLAKERQVESSHIGAGGVASKAYAKYLALAGSATEDEMIALLDHEGPVVRAYAAEHVAGRAPAGLQALVALASDETIVQTQRGCMGGGDSMGALVREALCESKLAEAGAALVALHDAGGPQAADALACAAPTSPALAGAAAVKALRRGQRPHAQAAYLAVFAVAPAPSLSEQCELARAGAASSDASVQIGAAKALWRCDDAASKGALTGLAGGRNVVVARHARASTFFLVPADRPTLAADREVLSELEDRLRRLLRSPEGTKAFLPLVEELVGAYPKRFGGAFEDALVTRETTEAALRLAAKVPPQRDGSRDWTRTALLRYLARAKDATALPELRRSLEAHDEFEVGAALEGVVALGDKGSRPAVEKLTQHASVAVARAARDALPKL